MGKECFPVHAGEPVRPGLMNKILNVIEFTEEDLIKCLK